MIWLALTATLLLTFLNGALSAGTLAASVISSRTMSTRRALVVAAACTFMGALFLGSAVVDTMGCHIVVFESVKDGGTLVLPCAAAACAALIWVGLGAVAGIPSSATYSLLGGWLGSFAALGGLHAVRWGPALLVLFGALAIPFLGFFAAMAGFSIFLGVGRQISARSEDTLSDVETLLFAGLAFSNGANSAQTSMALLAVAAIDLSAGAPGAVAVPGWVRVVCALAFSSGILLGATRTLRTVGFGIFRVGKVHSFVSLAVSGALVLSSTLVGLPLSPGQLSSACLLGVGAGHNPKAVRWRVAQELLVNWMLTIPAGFVLGFFLTKVL